MKNRVEQIKKAFLTIRNKGGFYVFIGNFLNKFVTLCGSIFVVRLLSKTEYGTLSYLENLYSYVYIFSGLGLAAALLRFVVIADTKEKKQAYYQYALKRQTFYNFIIIVLVMIINMIYSHPSEYINAMVLFAVFLLDIPFNDINTSNLSTERAMFANKRYAYISLLVVITSVVFRIIGSYYWGLEGNIVLRIIADVICALVLCCIVKRKYFRDSKADLLSDIERKEINKYAFHNMLANGFWVLYMITDMFLLARLLNDPTSVADYKVAVMIASNIIIISNAIVVFVGPYFIQNENNHSWVMKYYKKVILINGALLGGTVLILILLAKPIIVLLYGIEYLNVVPLMRILLIAAFFNGSFRAMNSSLLATMGHPKINMAISAIGFVVQIVACLIVIPRFGILGLAIENVVMYIVLSILFTGAFVKTFSVKGKDDSILGQ